MISYRQFAVLWRKHVARKWWFGLGALLLTIANGLAFWTYMLLQARRSAICAGIGALCGAFTYFAYLVTRKYE